MVMVVVGGGGGSGGGGSGGGSGGGGSSLLTSTVGPPSVRTHIERRRVRMDGRHKWEGPRLYRGPTNNSDLSFIGPFRSRNTISRRCYGRCEGEHKDGVRHVNG